MAQQQQLLIVLGLLVIGTAVAMGLRVYQENLDSIYLMQIEQDLVYLATKSIEYYHKPENLGGGEKSFSHVRGSNSLQKYLGVSSVYTSKKKAYNATFKISSSGKSQTLQIQADGLVMLRNKIYPRYTITVTGKDYKLKRVK